MPLARFASNWAEQCRIVVGRDADGAVYSHCFVPIQSGEPLRHIESDQCLRVFLADLEAARVCNQAHTRRCCAQQAERRPIRERAREHDRMLFQVRRRVALELVVTCEYEWQLERAILARGERKPRAVLLTRSMVANPQCRHRPFSGLCERTTASADERHGVEIQPGAIDHGLTGPARRTAISEGALE